MSKKIMAALMIALAFSSCKKDKDKAADDTTSAEDHVSAETLSNDIVNIGEQASTGSMTTYKHGGQSQSIYSACAVITSQAMNSTDADTLTVDFGTGCTGHDGRSRSGILQYIYTGGLNYRDSGNVINVYATNYTVDSNAVTINSKTIINQGHITSGKLTWKIDADISVAKYSGGTFSWTGSKTKVLLAGEQPNNAPIDWVHAQFAIYGTASGTSANGKTFSATVNQSTWLVRNFNCTNYRKYFVAGELDFTPQDRATHYVNFGTGDCDNLAVITINGVAYNITLH